MPSDYQVIGFGPLSRRQAKPQLSNLNQLLVGNGWQDATLNTELLDGATAASQGITYATSHPYFEAMRFALNHNLAFVIKDQHLSHLLIEVIIAAATQDMSAAGTDETLFDSCIGFGWMADVKGGTPLWLNLEHSLQELHLERDSTHLSNLVKSLETNNPSLFRRFVAGIFSQIAFELENDIVGSSSGKVFRANFAKLDQFSQVSGPFLSLLGVQDTSKGIASHPWRMMAQDYSLTGFVGFTVQDRRVTPVLVRLEWRISSRPAPWAAATMNPLEELQAKREFVRRRRAMKNQSRPELQPTSEPDKSQSSESCRSLIACLLVAIILALVGGGHL